MNGKFVFNWENESYNGWLGFTKITPTGIEEYGFILFDSHSNYEIAI